MIGRIDEEKRLKWGFDFKAGRPVPEGHPLYEWLPVPDDSCMPSVYHQRDKSWAQGIRETINEPLGKKCRRSNPSKVDLVMTAAFNDGVRVDASVQKDVLPDTDETKVILKVGEIKEAGMVSRGLSEATPDEVSANDALRVGSTSSETVQCVTEELSNAECSASSQNTLP